MLTEKQRELERGDYKALQQGVTSDKTPDQGAYPKGEQEGED